MELRSLFNQFVKIIGESHTSVNVNQPLPFKGIVSSFYQLGQKVNPTSSRRRRSKFGGSDGTSPDD
uniref:Ovule protein n=1 Tax=Heterorhabditis bacteriophora TaxID=37862 RepID=A0A1I7WYE8_HETBA